MDIASLLLTGGGFVLNFLVIPTLIDEDAAIPRMQSFPSAIALFVMTAGYLLLGVIFPAIATAIGGVLWTIVGFYRYPEDN
jgi:hypothetical protein